MANPAPRHDERDPINKIKGPPVSGKTLSVPEAAWLT
jgi:hypothetical protein